MFEDDPSFRRMRDKAAFHVDEDVVSAGIDELIADRKDVILCRGDGRKSVRTSMSLGTEALFNGLRIDLDEYRQFVEKVGDDHGIGTTIEEAFILATRSAGIPFGDD